MHQGLFQGKMQSSRESPIRNPERLILISKKKEEKPIKKAKHTNTLDWAQMTYLPLTA
jgi:hypothetical protein